MTDRALFVQTYRELWEKKYGEIKRGGDRKSKGKYYSLVGDDADFVQLEQVIPISYTDEENGKGATLSFAKHVVDRIGLSQKSVRRFNCIARHLQPELRSVLRGTALADIRHSC
ncbi:hypothetical protein BHOIPH791_15150 [Bartonella henselae]|uniref:Hypothetical genomic island protein n=1 Tax=Bartonella henselae (strain ATCC 49882 / DSM 28221 / CCUG 30454 / Houston 1) TaxID=283166 RepID=A0A0H3LYJ5_BARHE|nr:hypothetical protein Q653_01495 [Bartonella henselae JK 42]ETS08589.1 hypothetical protein Q655_00858 [Bartonella henselae JK 51]ETS09136.1 hypothetical protein Q654_00905 [Bartonella henselae JK 50]ETS12127.1 hypothetical protein Q652_01470 [Bartonella henselae JK 41]KEC56426.1 hypothetical protein O97_01393 [Bartonella henselae str. Zeus]KEC59128.1 hypothetical protein O95_01371 [Bartonella henselae JK 53]CAF27707.1 hypothetical genomic island protein [Bartonella henselae str. Houston-1]